MSYYLYWGKAIPADGGDSCHLLPYHSLDVAAAGWLLLAPERPLTRLLAARLDLPPEGLRRFLVFLLGLHDLGKFARAFQGVARPQGGELVSPIERLAYTERHDRLGALLWQASWIEWLRDGTLRWPDCDLDRKTRQQLSETLRAVLAPMFGHHGQPVGAGRLELADFFGDDCSASDCEAARQFVADWATLLDPNWPVQHLVSPEWREAFLALSWTIAGWATLSDWLGSNRDHFEYRQDEMPLDDYWPLALERAQLSLQQSGFADPPKPVAYTGLSHWFGGESVTPTPLQREAETLTIGQGPQLFILEDVTGSGKTEAACILSQRLLAAGHGEGLYFALPTMATSNAMYERLGNLHQRFYAAKSRPSFVLAHGARDLNDTFVNSVALEQPEDQNYAADDITATTYCNRWLADSRKKSLLADVGVGTIDQALMGLLPFRHQSLRLYGLARKVLIVDEVHAYDHYMQTLLQQLLTHHARQGGSAILLTATLPHGMREELAVAWRQGLGQPPASMREQAFPLLTQIDHDSVREVPLSTRPEVAREVGVRWLTTEEQAFETVMAAVEAGECVAWVRNTVDDAIRAFEQLRARHPDPERCLLFHSRFAMTDRQRIESDVIGRLGKASNPDQRRGQVLISTQVFQESLDCDVDYMVSDLAPIDLLIQRAGRLQRHTRGSRRQPLLAILAPEWSDTPDAQWLKRTLPGTQAVYRDTSLLWLTQRVLRELGAIRMPEEARTLIESVYGSVADLVPDGLLDARFEQHGMRRHAVSMASFNVLSLEQGYLRHPDFDQWQEEQEIGTRLVDEPTVNVVLLKHREDGELTLWAEGQRHADMLSQVKLRQSQAEKLAGLSCDCQPQWEALQEQSKALRFTQPWLVEADTACTYDGGWGVVFSKDGNPR
ncbi:CRISPR-associated helicase Cas3' [Ectothiorhodospira lacustris]|uniref:CRISPR-associated helicase Cas3' n=1 Tax=Ectothiorhodospira lacustris TaxID=2899127 RepID=UPI001EE9547F|nr:CRISPR-associated helicase Cas3' [Ectothiorhodospira lacustris]MCG5510227.1 CRISPR-associated helicase Cas3' [Ectothiorhodospira lacustris]MCG5521906.1 CRISPR-associated helicase Cas3' [Ectothiorhodospira lacustris]